MCLHSRHYLIGYQHNLYSKNIIAFTFDIQWPFSAPSARRVRLVHQIKSRTSTLPVVLTLPVHSQHDRKQEDNDSHR